MGQSLCKSKKIAPSSNATLENSPSSKNKDMSSVSAPMRILSTIADDSNIVLLNFNLLELFSFGIIVFNMNGKIQYLNRAVESLLDYRLEEVIQKDCSIFKPDINETHHFDIFKNNEINNVCYRYVTSTIQIKQKNSSVIHVSILYTKFLFGPTNEILLSLIHI